MDDLQSLQHFKGAIILIAFALLFFLERRYPMVKVGHGLMRLGRNFSLIGINSVLSPFVVIPLTVFAAGWALDWRPAFWSGWFAFVIDFLVLDCWLYFWHRLNHRLPILWRFHEVHHLDETLDATTALRFHFGEVLLSAVARAVFIFFAGVPLFTVIAFEVIIALASLFHHSNVKLPPAFEKDLAKIIVTPSLHWVHHHAVRADTDSNYATVLSMWDVIFISRSKTQRTLKMPIGVEARRENSLYDLIVRPFR